MANNANASISASILNDIAKKSLGGNLSFSPRDTSDLWFYSEMIYDSTSDPVIKAGMQYFERAHRGDGTELVTDLADMCRWLAFKNTGTTDGTTTTTDGVVMSLDGDSAAYDEQQGVYIGAGELWVSKFPGTTLAHLHAATVAVTNDAPTGTGGDVMCIVAAIIEYNH